MQRNRITFFPLVLGLLFSLTLLTSSVQGMASRPPLAGSQAPDFRLSDLAGNPVELQDYQGKVVLLNFWATWCKPCTKEMPAMEAAHMKYQNKGLVILAINELEDRERVVKHIQSHQHTFRVLMDRDNHVANLYGVVGLPVTVFIDREGRVQKIFKGGVLTEQVIGETFLQLTTDLISPTQEARG